MGNSELIAVVSTAIAVVALVVSYVAYRGAITSAWRPALVFAMKSHAHWEITNAGTGPAIRLVVIDKSKDGRVLSTTNCYPLAAGAVHSLDWLETAGMLEAVYEDVDGRLYSTECNRHQNVIKRLVRVASG